MQKLKLKIENNSSHGVPKEIFELANEIGATLIEGVPRIFELETDEGDEIEAIFSRKKNQVTLILNNA